MKRTYPAIALLMCFSVVVNAQWVKQTSPTGNDLYDIEFANSNTGFAVGASGTILKTTNGGVDWQLLKAPASDDFVSVTIIDSLNVFATTSGNAAIYKSIDGGISWQPVLNDLIPIYITHTPDKRLFSVSRKIYSSNNKGTTWQPVADVNSTSIYKHISFADNTTGMAAGNISGFVTYSADFLRTFDGGNHWYHNDPFKFPNANGFTAMNSLAPDSVFMFTNFYNRFMEGDSSQLIFLYNFRLRTLDSSVVFKSAIVIKSFPDIIRDCKFFTSGIAYAAGDKGVIYASKDRGQTWKPDYKNTTGLHALFMLNERRGYAVGNKGLILKRNSPEPRYLQKMGNNFPVIRSEQ